MITIKKISADETYKIRLKILRSGMDLPVEFSGDFDKDTFHLGVFENNELKAVSSFLKNSNILFDTTQYQLRGMATLTEVRGKGYGKKMLLHAFGVLKEEQIDVLWCNAREVALNFYLKLNFEQKGEPFDIPEVGEHYCLFKHIEC
jgi:predicted GNAT family N-acyltransferase